MTSRRRIVFVIGSAIAVVAIFSLIAPPDGGGTSVFERFLSGSGVAVQRSGLPPTQAGGTFFLLIDRRTPQQEAALLSWVSAGGRLIVADPGSWLFARFGVTNQRAGVFGTTVLSAGCVRPEMLGVQEIEVSATDQLLTSPSAGVSTCAADGASSYVIFLSRGRGEIVLLGGASFLEDDLLNHADNAVFARGLADAGGPLVLGPASPPASSPHSLWALIPRSGKTVIWELVIATIIFALARGRRVGRPVPEVAISPIPSGELVHATARLYRLAGARAFCADIIRRSTIDRIARRLGLPPDGSQERQAEAIAHRIGGPDPAVPVVLRTSAPASDEAFVALCRELERLAHEIEGAER